MATTDLSSSSVCNVLFSPLHAPFISTEATILRQNSYTVFKASILFTLMLSCDVIFSLKVKGDDGTWTNTLMRRSPFKRDNEHGL